MNEDTKIQLEALCESLDRLEVKCNESIAALDRGSQDIDKRLDQREYLMDALKSLRNDVAGLLGICEPAIRIAAGHTNVNCIHRRLQEADLALARAEVGA